MLKRQQDSSNLLGFVIDETPDCAHSVPYFADLSRLAKAARWLNEQAVFTEVLRRRLDIDQNSAISSCGFDGFMSYCTLA